MTDQPQDYAKWCAENLPEGWKLANAFEFGFGCVAYQDARPGRERFFREFNHPALTEIDRLRSEIKKREIKILEARLNFLDLKEYWNGSYNERAMSDACDHTVDVATRALAALKDGKP